MCLQTRIITFLLTFQVHVNVHVDEQVDVHVLDNHDQSYCFYSMHHHFDNRISSTVSTTFCPEGMSAGNEFNN